MDVAARETPLVRARRRISIPSVAVVLVALAAVAWFWYAYNAPAKTRGPAAAQIVSAVVAPTDLAVRFNASGTVEAVQTVDVRPQNSATIKTVNIREGQFVKKGERLFTLDARTEDANLDKARAQVLKDRADLDNAERNLERQKVLFKEEYVSRSELDTAQNQVDELRGQLAADLAAAEANRVARSFDEIDAPIAGYTGAIAVHPGSLVQPGATVLVNIAQIDVVKVSFTLPERQFPEVQQALAQGQVPVGVQTGAGQTAAQGHLVFVDNTVDSASGSIRLKAEFPNQSHKLWPGMYVTVALQPRVLAGALTVPVQAVQTGPERRFVYVIGADNRVSDVPVKVRLIQDGVAVIEGVPAGTRVVAEGAQNLRPGGLVTEQNKEQGSGTDNRKRHGKPASQGAAGGQ